MNAILPPHWDPQLAADKVLANLVTVTSPVVKGAHDSDFVIVDGKAYIVYMANDVQPGEASTWPFVYNAMTIVDVATGELESTVTFAASEMKYQNASLPVGACFVPRIIEKDATTLRCFFASEDPEHRQSQTWYIDFNRVTRAFDWNIYQMLLETDAGLEPMQPVALHRHVAARGFARPLRSYGLYLVDSFKRIDGVVYAMMNNYPHGPSSLTVLNDQMNCLKVIGSQIYPTEPLLSETSFNKLPDGTLLAVSRQEGGSVNYMFSESRDGENWTPNEHRDTIVGGGCSKGTFDLFGGVYYLGWQDASQINGADRSIFNIDVSRDGANWERKYRFETERSFQYPVFRDWGGHVYVTVTQGGPSSCLKERIMFGRVE
ncbi:MAG TPA: sialidase family protein [Capsulimonadaceae bacterium]